MITSSMFSSAIAFDENAEQKSLSVDRHPVSRQCIIHVGGAQLRVLCIAYYSLPALFVCLFFIKGLDVISVDSLLVVCRLIS